jgi:FAD-linked oxidoreductase
MDEAGESWRNWSGSASCRPARLARPADENELAEVVRAATELRAVGAGHSFSPLVPSAGTLLSLDRLAGLLAHDRAGCRATVAAGTRIAELGPLLEAIGQALPNQGDIDRQSIAGAVSTGTHGTGITLGSLSAQVRSLRLVTAGGDTLDCSPEQESEIFAAARLSLGALGVLTRIELQNRPSYRLEEKVGVAPLEKVLAEMAAVKERHRHAETWVFPYGKTAILKTLDETTAEAHGSGPSEFTDNVVLKAACELVRLLPASKTFWQKAVGFFVGDTKRVGDSWRIFPSPREVRFHEMEYHLPADQGPECLAEVVAAVRKADLPVFFPIEFRYVAGDDIWLSPFQGGARASIAMHQYWKQDPRPLFRLAEPILLRRGGRPHWGKMFDSELARPRELYPDWEKFQAVRRRLDPGGKFLNPFLRKLFEP